MTFLGLEWYWWILVLILVAVSIPLKVKFMKWWSRRQDKSSAHTDKWGDEP